MGAWIEISVDTKIELGVAVAPLVGAWIEILLSVISTSVGKSLLSWERGLKSI